VRSISVAFVVSDDPPGDCRIVSRSPLLSKKNKASALWRFLGRGESDVHCYGSVRRLERSSPGDSRVDSRCGDSWGRVGVMSIATVVFVVSDDPPGDNKVISRSPLRSSNVLPRLTRCEGRDGQKSSGMFAVLVDPPRSS
jgi:hypothetical protein